MISLHMRVLLALIYAACASMSRAQAQDFYRGKQINFVVAADAGNSYDFFARMMARYLPRYIPGEPHVIVQNMPGAGGLRAANWLYNAAPRDGLVIGMINNTLAFDPLFGNKQAQFDAVKFNWLGTPSQESAMLVVWHSVPVDTIEAAKNRELILSATGNGSTPAFFARVLAAIFDLRIRIIPGYKSQRDSFLAMERGENDGNASPFWTALMSETPTWVTEKKIKLLVYYGRRDAEIPARHVLDIVSDPEKRAIMEVAQAGLVMGRPVLAPPGTDAAKAALLRKAFDAVFLDKEYLAECALARLNCSQPSSGAAMLDFVRKTYDSPRGAVEKITEIYMEGQRG